MTLLHIQINKKLSESECERLNAVIGLSIRFNMFRNRRTNRNWILCMCSHASGNVCPACSNPAMIDSPYNTP